MRRAKANGRPTPRREVLDIPNAAKQCHLATARTPKASAEVRHHISSSAEVPEVVVDIASPRSIAITAQRRSPSDSMMREVVPPGTAASVVDSRTDDLSASTIAANAAPDIDRFESRQPTPRGDIGGS